MPCTVLVQGEFPRHTITVSSRFQIAGLKGQTNIDAIKYFTNPVGCVPRTHLLIGVIGDHVLQGCKGIKCGCINTNNIIKKTKNSLRKVNQEENHG
jgi:hypothetical protein